jgi:hypothetical protein
LSVQLPVGLTCDNCALLWEWINPHAPVILNIFINFIYFSKILNYFLFKGCKWLENGSYINNLIFRTDIGAYPCPGQNRRGCADIKIVTNPAATTSVYTPNPVKKTPKIPATYECQALGDTTAWPSNWNATISGPWWNPNSSPDPNQYTGDILVCWMNSGTNCESCRINCGFQGKTCPDYCYCRWLVN